ncbi:3-dehydroquinate dehydratase [Anaerovirgula multivorans]|uniref:3-dehydroquinate dehydratase n=1 Tax=Anaerovirgula multivorans TaxID=312168 RepID=A0A239HJH8_9FIRM|nr:type I 3-dehydroquinate dehydratase [Anaerovirgula multivorans]SNS81295.1 3-dehydroquinate dehydratase [Anaerovirgula multivorans]
MIKEITPVVIKGRSIGGEKPQVCVPLVGKTEEELLREAEVIADIKPDLVEWRIDFFDDVEDIEKVIKVLEKIHNILSSYPMIFTCRAIEEGGYKEIDQSKRINLIQAVIATKLVDLVDIELINGADLIKEVLQQAHENHVKVIVSNHDFRKTPSKETIVERLVKAQEYGADIAKIAVMPTNERDVLTLLEATLEVKEKAANIPLITMSMSGKGVISRIAGGIFGSAVTFAAGKEASAPGQIAISRLRQAIDILYASL